MQSSYLCQLVLMIISNGSLYPCTEPHISASKIQRYPTAKVQVDLWMSVSAARAGNLSAQTREASKYVPDT
ncbi:hypothetical protein GGI42DRAFT_323279 [Trichoderma sp. SZMC 28013]